MKTLLVASLFVIAGCSTKSSSSKQAPAPSPTVATAPAEPAATAVVAPTEPAPTAVTAPTEPAATAVAPPIEPAVTAVTPPADATTPTAAATAMSAEFVSAKDCAVVAPKVAVALASGIERGIRAGLPQVTDQAILAGLKKALAEFPAKMPAFKKALIGHCTDDEWPKDFGTCLSTTKATDEELLGRCAQKLPNDKGQKLQTEALKFAS